MMKTSRWLSLALCLAFVVNVSAQQSANYEVIPLPQHITTVKGDPFVLNASTQIAYPEGNALMKRNAEFLAEYIQKAVKLNLAIVSKAPNENAICLLLNDQITNKEGYQLQVDKKLVKINGASENGVFYGIQTLRKSLPILQQSAAVSLPAVQIADEPRFGYRGIMLDVGRHYFDVDVVKQTIDMLALHNQNVFHWHLTEDQGWRIEIKKYPRLTEVGSIRERTVIGHNTPIYDNTPHSGYFTQEQAREIVKYAQERYITVIPEIDMPGHMVSALASYPELGCTGGPYKVLDKWGIADDVLCIGNDKTFEFIEGVLSEIIEIFPSKYIHIGGDEAPRTRWHDCAKCQERIRVEGIKADGEHSAEDKLQSYFMARVERFLNAHGRQIIGWDEILDGDVAPNATVMSWRGMTGGIKAAKLHHDVIMSPTTNVYLDYYQSENRDREPQAIGGFLPLEKVYELDPTPSDQLTPDEKKHIIGVQANLWTEYIAYPEQLQYMYMPRVAAVSEVQWCDGTHKDYELFKNRLPRLVDWYRVNGWQYARHALPENYK